MCWLKRVAVFLMTLFIVTASFCQKNDALKKTSASVETETDSITSNLHLQKTMEGAKKDSKDATKKILNEKKAQASSIDVNALKDDSLVWKSAAQQPQQIKTEAQSVKNNFSAPKFSDVKIDTGEIPLNKEGLTLRGKSFLKSNSNSYALPKLQKQSFKVPKNNKKYDMRSVSDLRNVGKISGGDAMNKMSSSEQRVQKSSIDKFVNIKDSISTLAGQNFLASDKMRLANAKTIYSERFIRKMRDSLGAGKADSLYKIAAPLLKKNISEHDLANILNNFIAGKTDLNPLSDSLPASDINKLHALPDQLDPASLSKVKLPDSVINELTPIRSRIVDNKYVNAVDSFRNLNLSADKLKLEEEKISENIKMAALKKKPNFYDRSYIDGLVGYLQTRQFSLYQASPSFAFHFTPRISLGVGPNVLVVANRDNKNVSAKVGLRSFARLELYKRKVFFQFEDDEAPSFSSNETIQFGKHTLLAGGGLLLPISKKLALNFSAFYKVNQSRGNSSPWLIRLGISAFKTNKSKV